MFRDPLVQKAWEIRHQAEQFLTNPKRYSFTPERRA